MLTIKLPELSLGQKLIYFQIIYNFLIKFAIAYCHVPSVANYLTDLITVALLCCIYKSSRSRILKNKKVAVLTGIVVVYLFATFISYAANLYSPMLYLWGLRNVFRFYVFLIACIVYLTPEDIYRFFDLTYLCLLINIPIITVQYFVMGIRAESACGLFSVGKTAMGGNGDLNTILCLVTIVAAIRVAEKQKKVWYLLVAVIASLYVATVLEIKVYYFEFIFILSAMVVFTRFSIKKLFIFGVAMGLVAAVIPYFYRLYPKFDGFFNLENVVEYAASDSGYTGHGDLNRITAFSSIWNEYLEGPMEHAFGIGLGNADKSSSFDFLNSSFFENHQYLHYWYFLDAWNLLETGLVGTICYLSIFMYVFIQARKAAKYDEENKEIYVISQFTVLFCILFYFYNQCMRMETSGYLLYLFVAIPFIFYKANLSLCEFEQGGENEQFVISENEQF